MNTDLKGELCEGIAAIHLMKMNFIVSKPLNKCRYDLLADINNHIYRIQVKKGSVKEDYIKFNTASVNNKNNKTVQYTDKEIDYFIVVVLETEEVYMIHVNDYSNSQQRFRLTKTKNNQEKHILYANDYLLKNFKLRE
jgi:hypothetical protein